MNIYEPLEDNEQDVMAELHYPPEGALTGLFLMGFPSDRIYMAYDCGDCYYFRYLGNETFGIDTDLILDEAPEHAEMGEKDKLYRKQDMSSCKLIRRLSASTQLNNCGSFHFTYEGSVQRFILLEKPSEQQVMDFLSDISAVYPPKSEKELAEEQKDFARKEKARALMAQQDPDTMRKCKRIGIALNVLSTLLMLGTLCICEPYEIWIGACLLLLLICILLCVCKPVYFTPWFTKREDDELSIVSMQLAFISVAIALLLRTVSNVNYFSYTKLIVVSVIFGIVLAVVLTVRDRVHSKSSIVAAIFYCIIAAFGSVGEVNYLLDSGEPAEKYVCKITDVYETEDSYDIAVDVHGTDYELAVSEEDFNKLSVGDRIPVYFYSGGLGIPFADIIRY